MDKRYTTGKIYKIVNVGYDMCYYGSTIQELSNRMSTYRAQYKRFLSSGGTNISVYRIFEKYGVENCKIELVESYACKNRSELESREGFYIRNNNCVNKIAPGIEARKEKIQAYSDSHKVEAKAWREANKDKVKEYKLPYEERPSVIQKKLLQQQESNARYLLIMQKENKIK